jgi:hypothetical protein
MSAVVKTPRTNIRIEGEIHSPILSVLKAEFGKNLVIKPSPDDALVDVFETAQKGHDGGQVHAHLPR